MTTELRGRRLRRPATAVTIATATLLLAGCGETPLSTFDAQSPIAERLDNFLVALLVVCGVVFVIVQGMVLYMARRFRVGRPDDESMVYPDEEFPDQVHGNTRLEIGWTILPTVIMAVVAFFTLGLLFDLDDVDAVPDRRVQSVDVIGQQWWWEFHYHLDDDDVPDIITAGEMPLPVGEEVELRVTSRDVIHSYWIPNLNGKRDAVPGRWNPWTMEAGTTGRFPGECTEYCGLSHAYMEKWVVGLEPTDWDTWAENQMAAAVAPEEGTPAYEGWLTFSNQCASCHVINGLTTLASGGEGPDSAADYFSDDMPVRYIDRQTQVAGAAPNLTKVATRSTFAGGIFELYENPDNVPYLDLAEDGDLNRGQLEAWIINAPGEKANFWDSPTGQRGMTPFESLSAEEVDNLVAFLMSLD